MNQMQTILNFYEMFLKYSSPLFTIIEGASTATIIIICRDKVKQLSEQDEGIQVKYISYENDLNIISIYNFFLYS